jgi:hypothetical protein
MTSRPNQTINLIKSRLGIILRNLFYILIFAGTVVTSFSFTNINVGAEILGNVATGQYVTPFCNPIPNSDFEECVLEETFGGGADGYLAGDFTKFILTNPVLNTVTPVAAVGLPLNIACRQLGGSKWIPACKDLTQQTEYGSRYQVSANVIRDRRNNKIVGIHSCEATSNGVNILSGSGQNNTCGDIVLDKSGTGEEWNGTTPLRLRTLGLERNIFNPSSCKTPTKIGDYQVRSCVNGSAGADVYLQNLKNGTTAYLGDLDNTNVNEKLFNAKNNSEIENILKSSEFPKRYLANDIYLNGSNTVYSFSWAGKTQGITSVREAVARDSYNEINDSMISNFKDAVRDKEGGNTATCEKVILDNEKDPIFQCHITVNGQKQYYDFYGGKLANNCVGFKIKFTNTGDDLEFGKTQDCITQEQYNTFKKEDEKATTAISQLGTGTIDQQKNEDSNKGADTFGALIAALFNVVAVVLVILVYFLASFASVLLSILGTIFINLLAINPADPTFYNAAYQPWLVIIGLANLITLSTFIIVGLGYILNLQSFKVKIQQFILNIAIFSLLLQLTMTGSALFVNISNGLGDVLIAAYAGVGQNGRPNKSGLIDFLSNSINTISIIRCGEWSESANRYTIREEDPNCNVSGNIRPSNPLENIGSFGGDFLTWAKSIPDVLSGNGAGRPVQIFIMESVYLVTVLFAVFFMFKGVLYVMFRVVGIWLLMVVSPAALALYFSPLKTLKKYGSDWLDKFWRLTLAYPAFVLGLIIISRLISGFSSAIRSDLNASASSDQEKVMALFITACLVAIVSIGAFSLLLTFMEAVFGALAKALLDNVKKGWQGLNKFASGVGAVSRIGGKVISTPLSMAGNRFEKLAQSDRFKNTNTGKLFAGLGNAGKGLSDFSDKVFAIPDGFASSLKIPSKIWKNFRKGRELEKADSDDVVDGAFEYLARKSGLYESLGLGKTSDFKNFQGIEGKNLTMEEYRKRIRDAMTSNRDKMIEGDNFSASVLQKLSQKPEDFDFNKDENRRALMQALKNPVFAQSLMNNDSVKQFLQNNINTLSKDLYQQLSTEYPDAIFYGGDEQKVLNQISSLSRKDAEKVNVGYLMKNQKAYQRFADKFPDLVAKSGQDYDQSSASKIAVQNETDSISRISSGLYGDNFKPIEAQGIFNTAASAATASPQQNFSQLAASLLNNEDLRKLTNNFTDQKLTSEVQKEYNRIAAASIFGAGAVSRNPELADLSVGNTNEFLDRLFSTMKPDEAFKYLEKNTNFGSNLLNDSAYSEASETAKKAMIYESARLSVQTLADQGTTTVSRLVTDLPKQLELKEIIDDATSQVKTASKVAKSIAIAPDEVTLLTGSNDTDLDFKLPSAQNTDQFIQAVSSSDHRVDYAAETLGINGEVSEIFKKKFDAAKLGITEVTKEKYKGQISQYLQLMSERKALRTHLDTYTEANISLENAQIQSVIDNLNNNINTANAERSRLEREMQVKIREAANQEIDPFDLRDPTEKVREEYESKIAEQAQAIEQANQNIQANFSKITENTEKLEKVGEIRAAAQAKLTETQASLDSLTVAIQENGEAVTDDFNKRASELNGVLQKAREVGRGLLGQVANSPYSTVQQAQSLEAQFKSSVDTTKAKIVKDGNRTSQSNVII